MLYLLSERESCTHVSWGTSYELEDILVNSCGASILAPRAWSIHPKLDIGLRKLIPNRYHRLSMPEGMGGTLIAVCMGPPALRMLDAIPDWRSRFDHVAAYVVDLYPGAVKRLPQSICDKLDALFISYEQMLPIVRGYVSCPVHLILQAADVLGQGLAGGPRPFEFSAYGRQPGKLVARLAERTNRRSSSAILLHSTFAYPYVSDWRSDRALFWQMLRRTRVSICYPFSLTHDHIYRGVDPLTARWFEGMAAGCVLAGQRPISPEAERLIALEDAMVELPSDEDEAIERLLHLARDWERCEAISRRNFQTAATQHDWRFRIVELLRHLEHPIPSMLEREVEQLKAM